MKKHSVNKPHVPVLHSILATQKLHDHGKKEKILPDGVPPPPDEATLLMLNKLAKESPFCYYYKGKTNDTL